MKTNPNSQHPSNLAASTPFMVHPRPTNREDNAWFGDPVPFFWNGTYHLFYVWDQGHLIMPRVSHRWGHFSSTDLVHWHEHPYAVQPDPEASDGTGSIFEAEGRFHMYFLGRYFRTNGEMYETLCYSSSDDLIHWEKNPSNPISLPDLTYYRPRDWRDGFPFWNEDRQEYWMLVTATLKDGPASRRGCLALLTSTDLLSWKSVGPYWTPSIGGELECPDLFKWGDWWYLLVSGTFGQTGGTIYRKSKSPEGPWETPEVETFDGPDLYACKTAGNEHRRILFGWVGTRRDDMDGGTMEWGGHAVMRELVQDQNGDLWAKCPDERLTMGTLEPAPQWTPHMGKWDSKDSACIVNSSTGFSYATADVPAELLFQTRIVPESGTRKFGVFVRTDESLSEGYQIDIDVTLNTLAITSYGTHGNHRAEPLIRPLPPIQSDVYNLTIVLSGSVFEVFLNDRTALVGRYYNRRFQRLGLFSEGGGATFTTTNFRRLPDNPW